MGSCYAKQEKSAKTAVEPTDQWKSGNRNFRLNRRKEFIIQMQIIYHRKAAEAPILTINKSSLYHKRLNKAQSLSKNENLYQNQAVSCF
ncbi:unnamed protein product [Blepharisma stoltei]|uniref:Uncharacterized protein n=1 Tax=Blepharisma stoltei TaxID=1481888 RepID=A0AAU9JYB8_9CILI|nr:unnamed protein product [Blepharisma stoltei]